MVSVLVGVDIDVLMTCDSALLDDEAFAASPLYAATILWMPATSVLVLHAAVPPAATGTAAQPAIVVPESLKLTEPLGAAPATVAVKVTIDPTVAGFAELKTVVVVAPGDFVAEPQLPLTPPAPFKRNVAVARHPAVIVIGSGDAPPSATGVIGCGA